MTYNNTVTLTGNIGKEAKIIKGDKTFATLSIATTDSYKDDKGNWVDKESVWHNVLVFNPRLVEMVKSLKKGARLKITGSLSYRPFEVNIDGKNVTKKEASIIAGEIESAPLYKKTS